MIKKCYECEIRDFRIVKIFRKYDTIATFTISSISRFSLFKRNYNHCENDATTLNNFSSNLVI